MELLYDSFLWTVFNVFICTLNIFSTQLVRQKELEFSWGPPQSDSIIVLANGSFKFL